MSRDQVILMYHGIIADQADIPPGREAGADLYDVPLRNFREQMAFIKDSNAFVVTFDCRRQPPDGKRIVLTFDDGEMNNFSQAFPVLKEFGFEAYFFVTANRVGTPGYMGWKELKTLRDANMVIGSHSLNHLIMTKLGTETLRQELEASKRVLEDNLQVAVADFSVPRGFYNKEVIDLAVSAGYSRVFISERQQYFDDHCLPRVAVKRSWPVARLEKAIQGRVPPWEHLCGFIKSAVRIVVGDQGYDRLRKIFLRK